MRWQAGQTRSELQRSETKPWHYVDIPFDAPAYGHARECPDDSSVVAQIRALTQVLWHTDAPPQERLVHSVGDVHQPLQAEDHGDRGGNEVSVSSRTMRTCIACGIPT
jgi:hypothetical protein